jgi:ABC-type dipeptide/oligopeptide/nickel transport system permease subunit
LWRFSRTSYDVEFIAGDWWVWAFPALGIGLSVLSLVVLNLGPERVWRASTATGA